MLRIYFYAVLLFVSLTVCGWSVNETEITVSATTPSVALFKNGVTVIHQEIEIPAPGVYCWDKVPKVIHGTFFIESDLNVEIQTSQRLITLPVDEKDPLREIADFEGTEVTVRFCDPKISPIQGKLYSNTTPQETDSLFPASSVSPPNRSASLVTPLKLKTDDGQYLYLTGQQILSIETSANERTEYRPVMIFHVSAKDNKTAGKIRLFYLTKGTTWAPSYRVNLLDDKRLQIEQSALIRNELMPLHDTEISLVSGFPQIESSQILSPLHPSQTLLQFFQQIQSQHINRNNRYRNNDVSFMGNALTQQAVHPYSVANTGFDTTTLTAGEGPDIHYNNIGRKTLDTGDTLSLSTGKGEADYHRFLECDLVSVIQNYYNNIRNNWQNQQADNRLTPEVFDVLKFPNPLPFPMTTAPATVTEKERFLGQSQSNWVNPGQIASVKITKVMNVPVVYSEQMDGIGNAEQTQFLGRIYIKRSISSKIEITNQRNEEIILHLNSVFLSKRDDATKIEPTPTKQSFSITQSYEPNSLIDLFWELSLKPGEKKTITLSGTRWFHN